MHVWNHNVPRLLKQVNYQSVVFFLYISNDIFQMEIENNMRAATKPLLAGLNFSR